MIKERFVSNRARPVVRLGLALFTLPCGLDLQFAPHVLGLPIA